MPFPRPGQAQNVKVTRLHVRYDKKTFPQDLMFYETNDKKNFQGRYILRHPWKGKATCERGEKYLKLLPDRYEKEAQNLAHITEWDINDIRKKMKFGSDKKTKKKWWNKLWD
jgi:hypothetical protein